MKYYVGLDVSLKEISVCVIDGDGKIKARGTTPADPMAVKSWFKKRSLEPETIVHESASCPSGCNVAFSNSAFRQFASMPGGPIKACQPGSISQMLPMLKGWLNLLEQDGSLQFLSAVLRRIGCGRWWAQGNV